MGGFSIPAVRGASSVHAYLPDSELKIEMTAGPKMIMNKTGKIQKIKGNKILTGTFCAISSARCERLVRISPAWMRSTLATGIPRRSA